MRAPAAWAAALAWVAMGCGGDAPAEPSTTAPSSTQASSSSTGAGPQGPGPLWASFVATEAVGEGPAKLRVVHQGGGFVTAQIGGVSFWQLSPQQRVAARTVRSADVQGDTSLGYHESESPVAPCVFLDVAVGGPQALEAGRQYTLTVTGADETLQAAVADAGPAAPFVALRVGATVALPGQPSFAVEAEGQTLAWALSSAEPSGYQGVERATFTVDRMTLTDTYGAVIASDDPVLLDGAVGYTILVGEAPEDDAAFVRELF